ncbi:MAG TPA: phosphatase PAP2 family protein [Flavitalea sp.]|nr:phosphatase PAP2 family protein [Flavitalea sp.]
MKSSSSFVKSYLKKLPVGFLILLAVFAGALLLFTAVAHEVIWEKEEDIDNHIFSFLSHQVISPGLTAFMNGVTYFASAKFLQITYAVLIIVYLLQKNFKRSIEIAVTGIGGFIVNYIMKLSFHRIRPPHPLIEPLQNFSFPSGHATSGFIFYGLIAYLVWKSHISKSLKYVSCTLLILFSLLIGFSRVYLRLHYPSDVLAGICIGFAWLLLAIYLFEKMKKKAHSEQQIST